VLAFSLLKKDEEGKATFTKEIKNGGQKKNRKSA